MEISREEWIAEFAARRWILVDSLGPDPHVERGLLVYESLRHLEPAVAAEEDLRNNPEQRWEPDSGWSTAL